MTHPALLIETWLPIAETGVESMRENSTGLHPPVNRLHVWWARRPLIASRAAVLASLLPAWSAAWPGPLQSRFPDQEGYHAWVKQLMGFRGDPVTAYKMLQWARANQRAIPNPYEGPRAFTISPDPADLEIMAWLLEWTWGTRDVSVLDPFAGGGSIPFEALRYGFRTYANDLNPVAATILKATLDYPARFGPALAEDIRKWGKRWYELVKPRLQPYFTPLPPGAEGAAYLWARTVRHNGKTVPLSPNWWLATSPKPVAVRLVADPASDEPRFEILEGQAALDSRPDEGTISRGTARNPWTGETIDGDFIKSEAQAGRMGQILFAVAVKRPGGFKFRTASPEDKLQENRIYEYLQDHRSEWIAKNFLPTEAIPDGNKTSEPRRYGEYYWENSFSPRQIVSLITFAETLKLIEASIDAEKDSSFSAIIRTYLAMALDKALIYNNRHCRYDPSRGIRSVFDRHDFAFVWSHAEFDASANLLPWVIDQISDAYEQIANMAFPVQSFFKAKQHKEQEIKISRSPAQSLKTVADKSIFNITVDPPYYDNVQYAELSDFFYVWLKRSVGPLFPEFFQDELTNKDDEAVANPARFAALGARKKDLAEQDYERKMAAAFREMHRVLRDDGSLTVMFTHKRIEAWDTLASALIGAGFAIQASWPVHTESEHSLHQAKKNAASSTILLVCRKRELSAVSDQRSADSGKLTADRSPVWWDDIQAEVRRTAREKAAEYAAAGISGADLYISVFGPTLSVISRNWPVLTSEVDPKTGHPRPLRPETALDLAREEVVRLRKQGLLAGREIQFDPLTDWYLLAWDAFRAEQFPYDEARKLALALGVDLDHDVMSHERLAVKKGEFVILQTPEQRRKRGVVDEDAPRFEHWIDAAHTALLVYAEGGHGACDAFLQRAGLKRDATFKALLQALLNAVPRTREKDQFVRPEARLLDQLRAAFYAEELTVPAEETFELPQARQIGLFENTVLEEENHEDEVEN